MIEQRGRKARFSPPVVVLGVVRAVKFTLSLSVSCHGGGMMRGGEGGGGQNPHRERREKERTKKHNKKCSKKQDKKLFFEKKWILGNDVTKKKEQPFVRIFLSQRAAHQAGQDHRNDRDDDLGEPAACFCCYRLGKQHTAIQGLKLCGG